MTLYLFTKDTPNTSNCYDKCATAWPPLLTTGTAVGKEGVDVSKLGTTKRTDGSMQVTYNVAYCITMSRTPNLVMLLVECRRGLVRNYPCG